MKWYIERTSIRTKLENINILFGSNKPKNKRKYNEDLWHSGNEDPEEGRLIVSVYAFENCYIERVSDALETEHIEKWCYLDDLL